MRWLIYVVIFINLTIAAAFAPHIYYNFNPEVKYVGRPYVPEYPCVIMKAPGVKYILTNPGGKIKAVYEPWKPLH